MVATATADANSAIADTNSSIATGDGLADTITAAVRLAVLCGVASCALQIAFGHSVLTRYTAAQSAARVAPAYDYVRIRALGAPAAVLARVSTATCLALKDPLTPLVAVSASGTLNLALDVLLVPVLGLGIRGAAWATVASEMACAAIVLRAVRSKLRAGRRVEPKRRSLLPTRAAVATYAAFAKSLTLTLAGKIATYSALAHVATTISVAGTAAHRVLMCVYWFMWPFAEVCSQVGQAFLPGARRRPQPLLRKLIVSGCVVGLACGIAGGAALACAPQLFSTDADVVATICSLVPLVASCIATLALMCSMEGALLASRQLGFLSTFYTANAVAMVAAFAAVERLGLGLRAACACMLGFQVVRVAVFGLRLRAPMGDDGGTHSWAAQTS